MLTTMWLEGLGDSFLINYFALGGKRGLNAAAGSYGLCEFDGSCVADINVKKSPDQISGKLFQAGVTGKNFPTGKISMLYLSDRGGKYRTYSIYLVNAQVWATAKTAASEEDISFTCSDISIDFG